MPPLLLIAGVSLNEVTVSGSNNFLGATLPNVSLILPEDLSNYDGVSCVSALDINADIGQWRYPNGTLVDAFADSLYRLFRARRVDLFRRSTIRNDQEGIYTCRIPDENGVVQTLYMGIYTTQSHLGDSKI